jgi:hypothetical protein
MMYLERVQDIAGNTGTEDAELALLPAWGVASQVSRLLPQALAMPLLYDAVLMLLATQAVAVYILLSGGPALIVHAALATTAAALLLLCYCRRIVA